MVVTGSDARILHVHPSRWCNLSCQHCYSSSGPSTRAALSPDLLVAAVEDAAEEGYAAMSVSGGEPLLYTGLGRILDAARANGMKAALVTNGMLLDAEQVEHLALRLDYLAISIDGRPERHDRMRGSRGAFRKMAARLPLLREAGIPFGFVFTLSHESFDDLIEMLDFAVSEHAQIFQIHLLDETGRAAIRLRGQAPSGTDAVAAWVAVQHLAKAYQDRISVTVDLAPLDAIPQLVPEMFDDRDPASHPLAALLSPLVIEDDGTLTPFQYGFDRRHAIGSLHDAPLAVQARAWKNNRGGSSRLRGLCRHTYHRAQRDGVKILTWYQELSKSAEHYQPGRRQI